MPETPHPTAQRLTGHDDPAVVATGLTLAWDDNVVLDRGNFLIPHGSHTAVIGPNGSGKTTLLRSIGGMHVPAAGQLRVLDRMGPSVRARNPMVAHVLQSTVVNQAVPLTVREVVTMGRYAHRGLLGRLRARDTDAIERAMERMGVAELANRQLVHLSGGQRQRVAVAQGLAQEADLLLLDEPVTGLDAPSLRRVAQIVSEEVRAGRTVVTTTHDVAEAGIADHVLLVAGEIVASGAPEHVLTPDNLTIAYRTRAFTTADGTIVIGDPHVHGHHD